MNIFLYIADSNLTRTIDENNIKRSDGRGYETLLLKTQLEEHGHYLYDLKAHKGSKIPIDSTIIFYNFPRHEKGLLKKYKKIKKVLILLESEYIRPDNYLSKNHIFFDMIFTWKDHLIDNQKYFKYWYPNKIPHNLPTKGKRSKFCILIAANKFAKKSKFTHMGLYDERINVIRWFEKNHPEQFDLYGFGWDRGFFTNRIMRKLNRYDWLMKSWLLKPHYPSYKGSLESKFDVLSKYKFSICYENSHGITNYISEKIFDCFFAGTIPIYFGAPDIAEQIPKETFIDKRDFKTYEELYSYLINMPADEYNRYFNAIVDFIKSDKIKEHSSEAFARKIIENIL